MKLLLALGFTTLGFLGGFLAAIYVAIMHKQNPQWIPEKHSGKYGW